MTKYGNNIEEYLKTTNSYKAIKIIKPSIIENEDEKLEYSLLNSIFTSKHTYKQNIIDILYEQYNSYLKIINKCVRKNLDDEILIEPLIYLANISILL